MTLYMYQFHLYGEYAVFSEMLDDSDLYCDCCCDSDELVFEFDVSCFDSTVDTLYIYQDCEGDFYVTERELSDTELYCEARNDYDVHILTFKLSEFANR